MSVYPYCWTCTPPPIQSTPLHLAAGYNRVGVVEVLIKHGADVHAKDKGGLVPLHNACSYGHYEVAELLVKVGILCSLAYCTIILRDLSVCT